MLSLYIAGHAGIPREVTLLTFLPSCPIGQARRYASKPSEQRREYVKGLRRKAEKARAKELLALVLSSREKCARFLLPPPPLPPSASAAGASPGARTPADHLGPLSLSWQRAGR